VGRPPTAAPWQEGFAGLPWGLEYQPYLDP